MSMSPWPVISITGRSGSSAFSRSNSCSPVMPRHADVGDDRPLEAGVDRRERRLGAGIGPTAKPGERQHLLGGAAEIGVVLDQDHRACRGHAARLSSRVKRRPRPVSARAAACRRTRRRCRCEITRPRPSPVALVVANGMNRLRARPRGRGRGRCRATAIATSRRRSCTSMVIVGSGWLGQRVERVLQQVDQDLLQPDPARRAPSPRPRRARG